MLQHRIEIDAPGDPGAVRHRFAAWLQGLGYAPTTPTFLSAITFQRGSVMGNLSSIDPRNLICTVETEFLPIPEGTRVTVSWKVVTAGQLVTRPDIAYWRREIAEAERVLRGDPVNPAELQTLHKQTLRKDMVLVGILVIPLVFMACVILFAAHLILFLLPASLLGFVAVYWILRAPRRL